mmetsp:Transcript_20272/g.33928  ORF Transcript_20272/g.33928 Transcript_20272/m.33928 type:complete len:244 (-) Transcript_20272:649-1380(-)
MNRVLASSEGGTNCRSYCASASSARSLEAAAYGVMVSRWCCDNSCAAAAAAAGGFSLPQPTVSVRPFSARPFRAALSTTFFAASCVSNLANANDFPGGRLICCTPAGIKMLIKSPSVISRSNPPINSVVAVVLGAMRFRVAALPLPLPLAPLPFAAAGTPIVPKKKLPEPPAVVGAAVATGGGGPGGRGGREESNRCLLPGGSEALLLSMLPTPPLNGFLPPERPNTAAEEVIAPDTPTPTSM